MEDLFPWDGMRVTEETTRRNDTPSLPSSLSRLRTALHAGGSHKSFGFYGGSGNIGCRRKGNMNELAQKECVPCKGGVPPLRGEELKTLAGKLDGGWRVVDGHHLEKEYQFKNFREAA
jgi:hypothetical protein